MKDLEQSLDLDKLNICAQICSDIFKKSVFQGKTQDDVNCYAKRKTANKQVTLLGKKILEVQWWWGLIIHHFYVAPFCFTTISFELSSSTRALTYISQHAAAIWYPVVSDSEVVVYCCGLFKKWNVLGGLSCFLFCSFFRGTTDRLLFLSVRRFILWALLAAVCNQCRSDVTEHPVALDQNLQTGGYTTQHDIPDDVHHTKRCSISVLFFSPSHLPGCTSYYFVQNAMGGDVWSGNSSHIPDKMTIPSPTFRQWRIKVVCIEKLKRHIIIK